MNFAEVTMGNKVFSIISGFFRWYFARWWAAPTAMLFTGLTAIGAGFFQLLQPDAKGWATVSAAAFLLFLFLLPVNLVIGILHFLQRHWKRGAAVWISSALVGAIQLPAFALLAFFLLMNEKDHFADHLKLPERIPLREPLPNRFRPFDDPFRAPGNPFQKQVLSAIGCGRKLPDDAFCRIPALEKLMRSPQGRQRLKNYLDASPDWSTNENSAYGFYATRNGFFEDGSIDIGPFHSQFPITNVDTGKREGIHSQYFFYISLDGKSWCRIDRSERGSSTTSSNGVRFSTWSWFPAGTAKVTILDETDFAGRQMTAKMLELAEKEFSALLLPPQKPAREPHFRLYNGMQGGMYLMDILCNPGEPGLLSLRANEITTGARLSEQRLATCTARIFGSDRPGELFPCKLDFTIYEGNWEQYYGAHFEVWFKPDSGGPERKLFEENYRIQGWMR